MPVDYVASLQDIILHRVQELLSCKWDAKIIAGGLSKEPAQVEKKGNRRKKTYFILINNPRLVLLVPTFVAFLVLDDLVDREVLEPCALSKDLTVGGLAHARGPCNDDVRRCSRHACLFSAHELTEYPPFCSRWEFFNSRRTCLIYA